MNTKVQDPSDVVTWQQRSLNAWALAARHEIEQTAHTPAAHEALAAEGYDDIDHPYERFTLLRMITARDDLNRLAHVGDRYRDMGRGSRSGNRLAHWTVPR